MDIVLLENAQQTLQLLGSRQLAREGRCRRAHQANNNFDHFVR